MGLFEALSPGPDLRSGTRAMARSANTPWLHNLHLKCLDSGNEDYASVQRSFLHPSLERVELEVGHLRGALFRHKDGVARPGILDLFGTGGGLMEHRAALLAAKGFTTLALAYFGYKDLPKTISPEKPIELDYFIEAFGGQQGGPVLH